MGLNFKVALQYVIPKQLLTIVAGKLAHLEAGVVTQTIIAWFVKRYHVNMSEAEQPDIKSYQTFNLFFTRALKANARPMAKARLICPVDGAISQFGEIKASQIFQAKNHEYSTTALLGGNKDAAKHYENGHFACLYLSPRDYHRIHMPCDGKLLSMTYVPGDLFSVNPTTAEGVPGLFARNERVVCEFESASLGRFVMVLVGATIVGSMATVWHGQVNPPRFASIKTWDYTKQNMTYKQNEEMGRFLLGSTVVMLFEKQDKPSSSLVFNTSWAAKKAIQLGELMAL